MIEIGPNLKEVLEAFVITGLLLWALSIIVRIFTYAV